MTRWAKIEWPEDFRMTASDLAAFAGFRVRQERDHWWIATEEAYRASRPKLLDLRVVIDPSSVRQADLGFLDRWGELPSETEEFEASVVKEVRRLLCSGPQLNQFLEASRLIFLTAPASQLRAWVKTALLESLRISLPGSRVAFVDYSQRVHTRSAFVRAMFAASNAPGWLSEGGQRGFGAMRGLTGGVFQGKSTLVDPLLAALFPWIYGVALYRLGSGFGVVLLGTVVAWRPDAQDHDLSEMLQASLLVDDAPPVRLPATPSLAVRDAEQALRWWVGAIDKLLGLLLDPALFARDEWYEAKEHMGVLLSFERLLASVLAALTMTGRDEYSRRLHLFESLDLFEGLRLGGYDTTLDVVKCERWLRELREKLPPAVASVVLPRCEQAVTGLKRVGDGFIDQSRDGDNVVLRDKTGRKRHLSLAQASVRLIRAVRNAGHGMSKELGDPSSASVLAAHDGTIPPALSDLGFFHLVRLLADRRLFERPWIASCVA